MNLLNFILIYLAFTFSIIGYGNFFALNFTKYNKNSNIGYKGIYGIFFLTLVSYLTNLLFSHGYFHNFTILMIGIFFFIQYFFSLKNLKYNKDITYFVFFLFISIFSILYFKSHDDFLYYHLSFIHNLTINKLEFGLGNFDLAFNHVSSLFFFHSLFNLPFTGDYFYFIGPALIMVFTNIILLRDIFEKKKKLSFNDFLSILVFIFINVFFYRLAEHGTDRSAIILIFLTIILIFSILSGNKVNKIKFENFIIFLTFIISLKSFYVIYSLLFLFLFFKYYSLSKFFNFYKSFRIINFSIIYGLLIIFYNIAYTGCLIYPVSFTCFESFYWGMDLSRIEWAASWYELWSKAGATPNYRVDNPDLYIQNFNWIKVWVENYFFNKVSDTLLGLLLTILILFFIFRPKKISLQYSKKYKLVFFALAIFFIEWFFNHPSLRYGGYHLIALFFFIPTAIIISNYGYSFNKNAYKIKILLLITISIFVLRNTDRILNENIIYSYNPLISATYKIDKNNYYLKNKKEIVLEKTEECKIDFKKDHNCKLVNSYRIFY